mmetsp:Transcript_26856/g.86236  ORF Transcript_26856/g.86236 Transcript_26856/m.86236 type:complete len:346 (+) Transcript_26856:678-1715(+)
MDWPFSFFILFSLPFSCHPPSPSVQLPSHPLQQVVKVEEPLPDLPNGDPHAELGCKVEARLDRLQRGEVDPPPLPPVPVVLEDVLPLLLEPADVLGLGALQDAPILVADDGAPTLGNVVVVTVEVQAHEHLPPQRRAILAQHPLDGAPDPPDVGVGAGSLGGGPVVGHGADRVDVRREQLEVLAREGGGLSREGGLRRGHGEDELHGLARGRGSVAERGPEDLDKVRAGVEERLVVEQADVGPLRPHLQHDAVVALLLALIHNRARSQAGEFVRNVILPVVAAVCLAREQVDVVGRAPPLEEHARHHLRARIGPSRRCVGRCPPADVGDPAEVGVVAARELGRAV